MDNGYAFAISDDGIMAGWFTDYDEGLYGVNFAGLWDPETQEWSAIEMNPDFPEYADSEYNCAWAMTNDGKTLAIMQYSPEWNTYSYLYSEEDGYVLLPHGTSQQSRPNAISPDGKIVAGHGVNTDGFWFACYWVDGEYYDFNQEVMGEAMAVSANGQYITGYVDNTAFLYDVLQDEYIEFENPYSDLSLSATCVSNDATVFGYSASWPPFPDSRRALAMTDGYVMTFNEYLLMNGVSETEDWTIYTVNTVSSDGRTFTGAANIDGLDCTFILTIEEVECEAPKNLTYHIDEMNDYDDIELSWTAPENAADVTYEIYDSYTATTPIVDGLTETSYTFVDMEAGAYSFIVKANWNNECLSPGSNMVRPEVSFCSAADKCELYVVAHDDYGDGWNNGYIALTGEESGMTYKIEYKNGYSDTIRMSFCPDVYTFSWVAGDYDEEVSFSIHVNDELIFNSTSMEILVAGTLFKYELDCASNDVADLPPFVEIADEYMFPYDISDNKRHVAIQAFEDGISYYWSEETGLVMIEGYAHSVSDDGIVAGYYLDMTSWVYVAGLWDVNTREWTSLAEIPGTQMPTNGTHDMPADYSGAWSMTNDGSTIAVMYTDPAWNTDSYLYTEADGYVKLEADGSSRPNAISNNARVVAGHGVADLGWTICYWIDGEYHEVPNLYGEALAVSSSGKYICGSIDSGSAFVIDAETEDITIIEDNEKMPGSYSATCVNNNGYVFGFYTDAFPPMPQTRLAFAYAGGALMSFNDYLAMNGYAGAEDWLFYSVNAVTADGLTFLCAANIEGDDCSVIITLEPAACNAPSNLTFTIDEEDYNNVTLSWNAPKNPTDVTYEIYDDYLSSSPLYSNITETSYTIEDLKPGTYNFIVRANWNDECLSNPTNAVNPTVYPCHDSDKCELTIYMSDAYADSWNSAYIEITGTKSDLVYRVELEHGTAESTQTLQLCPDTYTFTWVKGQYDEEIGFAIFNGEEELYSVKAEGITSEGIFLEYDLDCSTNIDEIASHDEITLMPNPAKDYFCIEGAKMTDIKVYNTIGQQIDAVNVDNDNVRISTAKYNEGVYFVKIHTEDADVIVRKIVVTK